MYFSVIAIPNLDLRILELAALDLVTLLDQRQLLKPEDITVAWRPLYEVLVKVMNNKLEILGLMFKPGYLVDSIMSLIRCSRDYFSEGATGEIMDELRPLLCPLDRTVLARGVKMLEIFLPTLNCHKRQETTYGLWLDELLDLYNTCEWPQFDKHLFSLFTRLSEHNIGKINWTPEQVSIFFTRIQTSFNLPVAHLKGDSAKAVARKPLPRTYAKWIVATLGSGSCVQSHLSQLFQVIHQRSF